MIALDTSVAVPLVVEAHTAHEAVHGWWQGRDVALAGHALAETYSVLTRLPATLRLTPEDAAHLMAERFGPPITLSGRATRNLVPTLVRHDITGGATYDALVGLAAREHDCVLATRDARALPTYQALGVTVEVVG